MSIITGIVIIVVAAIVVGGIVAMYVMKKAVEDE